MKVTDSPTIRKNIIKLVRKHTVNKYVWVYNPWFKDSTKRIILPFWYSDTWKLCYPETDFTEDEVKMNVKSLNMWFRVKHYDNLTARYERCWVGALREKGWKIVFDFAD